MSTLTYAELADQCRMWRDWTDRNNADVASMAPRTEAEKEIEAKTLAEVRERLSSFERDAEESLTFLHPSEVEQARNMISYTVAGALVSLDGWDEWLFTHTAVSQEQRNAQLAADRPPVVVAPEPVDWYSRILGGLIVIAAFICLAAFMSALSGDWNNGDHAEAHRQALAGFSFLFVLGGSYQLFIHRLRLKHPNLALALTAATVAGVAAQHHHIHQAEQQQEFADQVARSMLDQQGG